MERMLPIGSADARSGLGPDERRTGSVSGRDRGEAPRGATIYDVARAAGVAPSTVSRAFSRPGRVNAATAERIRQVADDLGYRANPLARALSTARSHMIALVVSDVANPFYSEIIRGAQSTAAAAGRLPDVAVTVLAAWLLHLRGSGAPVRDVRADELRVLAGGRLRDAVPAVLAALGPDLADDAELVGAVRRRCEDLSGRR
jgi:LacI family transcriptional regulator, repressor for deo operon, udp, cdd, tsx, nupC, and nupG